MSFQINRSKCKPCFQCHGIGKVNEVTCDKCGGYGSISLKILEQARRKTNEGKGKGS